MQYAAIVLSHRLRTIAFRAPARRRSRAQKFLSEQRTFFELRRAAARGATLGLPPFPPLIVRAASSYAALCSALLGYAMLGYARLRYVMLGYAKLC